MFFYGVSAATAQGPAKAIFFELGGPGLASINYDMRFSKSEKGLGAGAGVGGFSIGRGNERGTAIFIPLAVNYIMSKNERDYFELGVGVTPVILREIFSEEGKTFSRTFGHVNIAYRLQPKAGGLFFRAAITPIFSRSFFWPYYMGFSVWVINFNENEDSQPGNALVWRKIKLNFN